MVCIVELPKLCFEGPVVKNEGERWQRFFVEGERLDPDNLPEYMKTPEMEKAMETLMSFHRLGGERAAQYLLEHFAELKANTIESAREQAEERERLALERLLAAEAKREAAEAKCEATEAKYEATEAKLQALQAKLLELGIEPDAL